MNTETLEAPVDVPATIVPTQGDNFELSATNPDEMVQCHHAAIEWAKRKVDLMMNEARELKEAYEHAKARKWKSDTLKRHWELAEKRVTYYQKLLAAFEAGYYIVPNFPVTLFAIRTDKKRPSRKFAVVVHSRQHNFEQEPKLLPVGEGEYQNPQPIVNAQRGTGYTDDKGVTRQGFAAEEWADLDFPANMARLHIMEATTAAMKRKIFDEIGFLPSDYKRNPDPLMIGRIVDPRPNGYSEQKRVSFIIGWHIDTKSL